MQVRDRRCDKHKTNLRGDSQLVSGQISAIGQPLGLCPQVHVEPVLIQVWVDI